MAENIQLTRPATGQGSVVPVGPDAKLEFAFDQGDANLGKDGQNLVFTFDDGGKLTLEGFYDNFGANAQPPTLIVEGNALPGEAFLAALNNPDLMPAAGPTAVQGAGAYDDALLSGVGGVTGSDKLTFDGWNNASDAAHPYAGATETVGATGGVAVGADPGFGANSGFGATPGTFPQGSPGSAPNSTPASTPEPGESQHGHGAHDHQPAPDPTPDPALASTPEPTPDPTPDPGPASASDPAPDPTPDPAPDPTPDPTPASASDPTPEPALPGESHHGHHEHGAHDHQSAPDPTPEPAPAPPPVEPPAPPTPSVSLSLLNDGALVHESNLSTGTQYDPENPAQGIQAEVQYAVTVGGDASVDSFTINSVTFTVDAEGVLHGSFSQIAVNNGAIVGAEFKDGTLTLTYELREASTEMDGEQAAMHNQYGEQANDIAYDVAQITVEAHAVGSAGNVTSGPVTVHVGIVDDSPLDFTPDTGSMLNQAGFAIEGNLHTVFGADGPNDATPAEFVMTGAQTATIGGETVYQTQYTSGGEPVYYKLSADGSTLEAETYTNGAWHPVFTATLDVATNSYSVVMESYLDVKVDTHQMTLTDGAKGGNQPTAYLTESVNSDGSYKGFVGYTNPGGDNLVATITAHSAKNGDSATVNNSTNGIGVDNQGLSPGDTLMFAFMKPQTDVAFVLAKVGTAVGTWTAYDADHNVVATGQFSGNGGDGLDINCNGQVFTDLELQFTAGSSNCVINRVECNTTETVTYPVLDLPVQIMDGDGDTVSSSLVVAFTDQDGLQDMPPLDPPSAPVEPYATPLPDDAAGSAAAQGDGPQPSSADDSHHHHGGHHADAADGHHGHHEHGQFAGHHHGMHGGDGHSLLIGGAHAHGPGHGAGQHHEGAQDHHLKLGDLMDHKHDSWVSLDHVAPHQSHGTGGHGHSIGLVVHAAHASHESPSEPMAQAHHDHHDAGAQQHVQFVEFHHSGAGGTHGHEELAQILHHHVITKVGG